MRLAILTMALGIAFSGTPARAQLGSSEAAAPSIVTKPKKKSAKQQKDDAPLSWSEVAASELKPIEQPESVAEDVKSKKNKRASKLKEPKLAEPSMTRDEMPSPATVRAEISDVRPAIRRQALRLDLTFEPYQARGVGQMSAGQTIDYAQVDSTVLLQADLRAMPMAVGRAVLGGYAAVGFAQSKIPLVAPTGFRYDDVKLNSLRLELGAVTGFNLGEQTNLELRLGVGRHALIQTSQYSNVVANSAQPYLVGAADLTYHFNNRLGAVASFAHREPIGGGSGSIAFDAVNVGAGLLIQVR